MMRFASLASGSRGNALVVELDDTLLMIDCGLPRREIVERLAGLGRCADDVTAVLVTHEHGDHLRGLGSFTRRYRVPVFMTAGTASCVEGEGIAGINVISTHRPLQIGAVTVEPFPVPHDAREPCQFVFAGGSRRLGLLTDTGHVTAHIRERLEACDALALECNHDSQALACGTYPPSVKARVASRYGHLDNGQAAQFLESFAHPGLQWVTAMHVSERNNSLEQIRSALGPTLHALSQPLHVAVQDQPSGWHDVL